MKLLPMESDKLENEEIISSSPPSKSKHCLAHHASSSSESGSEEQLDLLIMEKITEQSKKSSSSSSQCRTKTQVKNVQDEEEVEKSCNSTNCHKILNIKSEFNLIRTLSKSNFGKVILGKKADEKMVLKVFHSKLIGWDEFQRELNYNYFLSPHPNIVTSYNVSFEWKNSYIFVQEYASFGDLHKFSSKNSILEAQIKCIAQQIGSALEFMHGLHLVHGDVLLENILVFKQDLSLVKLCDFGSTQPENTLMVRRVSIGHESESTFPPEICDIIPQEKYYSNPCSDAWQLGICLLTLLNGSAPWAVADITDSNYLQYIEWLKRRSLRLPESFKYCSARFIRLMKRLLEPKPSKRSGVKEVYKYMKDSWIEKSCSSMYSCRKCPSNSSVNNGGGSGNGRHNSIFISTGNGSGVTPTPSRKESTTSNNSSLDSGMASVIMRKRSVSPSCTTINSESESTTATATTTKIIIGQVPTSTTTTTTASASDGNINILSTSTSSKSTTAGRVMRAKSLRTSGKAEPCRRHHTFRDISPSITHSHVNGKGLQRHGYSMRRCTSYELGKIPCTNNSNNNNQHQIIRKNSSTTSSGGRDRNSSSSNIIITTTTTSTN